MLDLQGLVCRAGSTRPRKRVERAPVVGTDGLTAGPGLRRDAAPITTTVWRAAGRRGDVGPYEDRRREATIWPMEPADRASPPRGTGARGGTMTVAEAVR